MAEPHAVGRQVMKKDGAPLFVCPACKTGPFEEGAAGWLIPPSGARHSDVCQSKEARDQRAQEED